MRRSAPFLFLLLAACATVPPPDPPVHAQVGVAFDANRELASFAEGIADPQSGRRVTADDPVRVASVSKMVVAIGVMKLVEAGKLDLTGDVSRWLGWSLRNPNFPDRPITLRMLLSHTSSVREHDDDYVIPLGVSLQSVMADPKNWDAVHGPGDNYFTYTNLNFPIVGSIIERVTGERFDIWMRKNVLEPMRLDACYNWPTCSDAADRPRGRARCARTASRRKTICTASVRPVRCSSRTASRATSRAGISARTALCSRRKAAFGSRPAASPASGACC